MPVNSSGDGLVVIAISGDNHPGLGSVSPTKPDTLGSITFQDER
jgi:hypothetical protein